MAPNEGGWTSLVVQGGQVVGYGWATGEAVLRFVPMSLTITKTVPQTQYLPGAAVPWTVRTAISGAAGGSTMLGIVVTDTLPADLEYDAACTAAALPAGVSVSYNAATRVITFGLGDRQVPVNANAVQLPDLTVCTRVNDLAQPGDTLTNTARASAVNSDNAPTVTRAIQVNGSGRLAISKSVDKPFVAAGEQYTWSLRWGNTSTVLAFAPPDVIDVLPWNGDSGGGSPRDQFATDFTGTSQITGALPLPTLHAAEGPDRWPARGTTRAPRRRPSATTRATRPMPTRRRRVDCGRPRRRSAPDQASRP